MIEGVTTHIYRFSIHKDAFKNIERVVQSIVLHVHVPQNQIKTFKIFYLLFIGVKLQLLALKASIINGY